MWTFIILSIMILALLCTNKERFYSNITSPAFRQYIPDKMHLAKNSANNVLTFTTNDKCDGKIICNKPDVRGLDKKVCWDYNHDCGPNYKYQHSTCLQKRMHNKDRMCASTIDIVPRPQDADNPDNFAEF